MSSKVKKPDIDKADIRARLEHAQKELASVRLRRWIPDSDAIDGYVLDIGTHWALLATQTNQLTPDGWTLVRLKDVQAVALDPIDGGFTTEALKARGHWPPAVPEPHVVDLDAVRAAVLSVAAAAPLITIHSEFARTDACWIGVPLSVDDDTLVLREVGTGGQWLAKPRKFDLDDITLVQFGGGYEDALHLVAGSPPA